MTEVPRARARFDSPRRVLSPLARKHRLPGAQQAIHHAGNSISAEFGEPEFRTGRHVTRDFAFPVGSITKCFTATSKVD
jgi:CubicO group peptidase (beta-lactamase class C family)